MYRFGKSIDQWLRRLRLCMLLCGMIVLVHLYPGKSHVRTNWTALLHPVSQHTAIAPPLPGQTINMQPATAQVIDASNTFGFQLYQQLSRDDLSKNLFISPFSISSAFAMAYNGANGRTKSELAKTLGWQSTSLEALNTSYQDISRQLHPLSKSASIEQANGLVAQQDYPLKSDFMQRCQDCYQADLATVDFLRQEAEARRRINSWGEQKTHGKIKTMLSEPLNFETRLVLINALYFKDSWRCAFYPWRTKAAPFTCGDGSTKTVPLMEQSGEYSYIQTDQFQAIRLPYSEPGYTMDIYLPAKRRDLATFAKQCTSTQWLRWQQQFKVRGGTIRLPRFKADYHLDLKHTLMRMGMQDPFSSGADFSGITNGQLFINNVFHRATLDVFEKGTEAAAETAIVMTKGDGLPGADPFTMTVDHPFFFAIRANDGTILFLGSIADPQPLEVTYQEAPTFRHRMPLAPRPNHYLNSR